MTNYTDRVTAAANAPSAGTILLCGEDPKALTRRAKTLHTEFGYDVFPVITTTPRVKDDHCDKTGKIIDATLPESCGLVSDYKAHLGNYMAATREDVMALIRRLNPTGMIVLASHAPENLLDSDILEAAKRVAPHMPKIYDIGIPNAKVPPEFIIQAQQNAFSIAGPHEFERIHQIFQAAQLERTP